MLVATPYSSFEGPKIIAGIRKKDIICPTPNIRTRLSDEGIDENSFKMLDENTITQLIPRIGPRLVFKNKYQDYLLNLEISRGLETFLKSSVDGRFVLSFKNNLGYKNNLPRKKLVKEVVNRFLQLEHVDNVSKEMWMFEEASVEITKLFPNERKEIYYIPYKKKTESSPKKAPKGRLWSRYHNVRTLLKVAEGTSKRSCAAISSVEGTTEDNENCDPTDYELLHNILEPKTRVLELWESTYHFRKKHFKDLSIEEIFSEVPALKLNIGAELINSDFNEKFPEKIDSIYLKWPQLAAAILKESEQRKVVALQDTVGVEPYIVALLTLPYLVPPVTLRRSKDFNWRPSRSEIQESFFFHAESEEDVEKILMKRKQKLAWANSTLQPFGTIIGPLTTVAEYRVYIGELLVKCGHEKNWWPRKVTVRGGHLVVSSRRTDDSLPTLRLPLRQLSLQAGPLVNSLALTKGSIIVLTIQTSTEQHFDLWVKAIAIELIRQTPLFAVKYLDILNLTEISKRKEPDRTNCHCSHSDINQETPPCNKTQILCPKIVEMHSNDSPPSTNQCQTPGKVVEEKTVETILKKCQNVETYVPVKEKLVLFESLCRLGRKVRSSEDVSYKSDVETKRARSMHDLSNVGPHVAVREICKYFENKTDAKENKKCSVNKRSRLVCSESQLLCVRNLPEVSSR